MKEPAPLVSLADRIALREDEAAAMLGISDRALRRLVELGLVRRLALPGTSLVMYSRIALERWALERTPGAAELVEASTPLPQWDSDWPNRRAVRRGRPRTGRSMAP